MKLNANLKNFKLLLMIFGGYIFLYTVYFVWVIAQSDKNVYWIVDEFYRCYVLFVNLGYYPSMAIYYGFKTYMTTKKIFVPNLMFLLINVFMLIIPTITGMLEFCFNIPKDVIYAVGMGWFVSLLSVEVAFVVSIISSLIAKKTKEFPMHSDYDT